MHGSISDEVVKNLDKFTSYRQVNKFKKIFNNLTTNHKNEYIRHCKAKPKSSSAMSGILNGLDKEEALSIFNQLPQEFAFNTLDCIHPTLTLFKILFNQLNPQQKEDYKVNLETKSTVKAKLVLKNFYLSNKESSSNLSTENSNEPLVQNRDDLPAANFSPISPAFKETVVEHQFDTRLELSSDKEDQSCSQTVIPFLGFAEFDNQFCNTVTENSTVSSSLTSNDNISDSLEGEQLSPEYYNYLINGVTSLQSSIVDDLPELNLSPITPAFEETVVEHTFDSRSDFSYENEPLVNKRKRAEENQLYSQIIRSITGKQRSQDLCFTAYNSLTECELEEICTVEPPAKRQCISVPSFEGFAEFHNQFCNIVPEDSIVNDSSVPEEHTSLEGELTFLDSQINGGEPLTSLQSSNVNPLPEFSFSLSSVTLDEMVKRYGFNHNDHALSDLEEVYVEQPAKFHTYYHNN
ncbi:hypothetical protein [Wolbachia endosymbiont (group B) of Villa cingulata]|uniref:hypothetical protein n=1 Tax=Wolbachia endosymbiont (group B) of Villa cingulata TaxID=3066157 RepID=UPI003341D65A